MSEKINRWLTKRPKISERKRLSSHLQPKASLLGMTQPSKGCQGSRSRVGAAQGWGTEVHTPSTRGRKQSPLVWRRTEKHSTRS